MAPDPVPNPPVKAPKAGVAGGGGGVVIL